MSLARAVLCVALVLVSTVPASAQFPTVLHEGRPYVDLGRIAETLGIDLAGTPASTRVQLRSGDQVVTVTRDRSDVLLNGRRIALGAPVRVRRGAWLVPSAFVTRVVPKLAPSPSASSRTMARTGVRASPAAVAPAATLPGRARLEELRFRSYPAFTRVVVETSSAVTVRVEARSPRQARLRLVGLAAEPRVEDVGDGFVEVLRLERAGADALLTVALETAAAEIKTSALSDPPRVVIDFARPGGRDPRDRRADAAPLRVMVLDAGHGGHDPGAIGPTGLTEKELVLDVTRRVARLVEDRLGVQALLSRDGDRFVPLRDRTAFANRQRADLFVSIHANAHRESASSGVEIYFLSSEATDNAARQVAALENAAIRFERPTAKGRLDLVKSILWDLAQSEYQFQSSRVAEIVLDSMTRSLRIPNRGVKQAGFYVLGGAAMPAVLIEIGFVTNPSEERKLKESAYRDEIARAISEGLAEYKRHWDERGKTVLDGGRPDAMPARADAGARPAPAAPRGGPGR